MPTTGQYKFSWVGLPQLLFTSQLSCGRRLQLLPQVNASAESKNKQARYYDRGRKERSLLTTGQTVGVKTDTHTNNWKKGQITRVLPYRSYEVALEDGSVKRRSSKYVRWSAESPLIIDNNDDPPPSSRSTSNDETTSGETTTDK